MIMMGIILNVTRTTNVEIKYVEDIYHADGDLADVGLYLFINDNCVLRLKDKFELKELIEELELVPPSFIV